MKGKRDKHPATGASGPSASHGQSWTVLSRHTMQPPDPPFDRVFLIWMGVFGKIVFWPWDRRGQAGAGPGFVLGFWLSQCIYANPLPCPAHTRLEEEGESKATLKTLSKNGKALFNFTNKIILKSLCQLFACDLIMEEYTWPFMARSENIKVD